MHDGGLERNSAAYVFEVAITLTEAGLAAAPGALCFLLHCLAMHRHPHLQLGGFDMQLPCIGIPGFGCMKVIKQAFSSKGLYT